MAATTSKSQLDLEAISGTRFLTGDKNLVTIAGLTEFNYAVGASTPIGGTSITLTASLQNFLASSPVYQWQYINTGNNTWTDFAGATNSTFALAHDNAAWGTAKSLRVRCTSRGYSAETIIIKNYDSETTLIYDIQTSSPVITKQAADAATTGTYSSITIQGKRSLGQTTTNFGFVTVTQNGATEAATATDTSTTPVTLSPTSTSQASSYTIRLYDSTNKTTLLDTQVVPVVFNGAAGAPGAAGSGAITPVLSNSTHIFSTNYNGTITSYTGSGTELRVFEGITELTYDGVGTSAGTWTISSRVGTGITATASITDSGTFATIAVASGMADATTSATIVYNISGRTAGNTTFTTTITQTFLKSKERSPIAVAIQGTVWSDAVANSHFQTNYGNIKVVGDRATIYDTATSFAATREWNGTAWVAATFLLDGNLLVNGTVTATKINSNGLSIRDTNGNLILSATAGSALDFANVTGTTKPANNATNTSIDANGQIQGVSSGAGTTVANDRVRSGGVNLVGNSGFLKNNGTLPTNWAVYNNGSISVTTSVQAGGMFGQNYYRVTANASTTQTLGIYVLAGADSVKAWEPGQTYCISFWARGSAGAVGRTMSGLYSNMGFTSPIALENSPLTGSWQRYVFRGVPVNNAQTSVGELYISWETSGTLASGSVIDICCPKVELGTQPSAWTPSPQDTLNNNISISSGAITGIGTGDGTTVANSSISIDAATGALNGIGTGTGQPVANNTNTFIRDPAGGTSLNNAASVTGSIKIRLPVGTANPSMPLFYVDIYEYLAGFSCTLQISGHNWSDGTWYNTSAFVIGASNVEYPVRFGRDAGGFFCVYIGATTETWAYPQIRVRDVTIGFAAQSRDIWSANWQVSFVSTFENVSQTILDTKPGADWSKTARRPTNLANLTGTESINNAAITLTSTGALQGAGGGQITTLPASGTSNTNEAPSWYPVGQTVEFKSRSAIGVVGVSLYGVLTTYKGYADASGGAVVQTFASQEALWKRLSVSGNYSQWTAWQPIVDQKLSSVNIERFMDDGAISSVKLGTTIESDNYISGQTGWRISRTTGNAEFQNVITRGTVFADNGTFKGNITGATGEFKGTISANAINLNETGGSLTNYYFGQGGTFTIPAGIGSMRATIVGGGGGGAPNTGNFNGAGGGGGGGVTQINVNVTPGASYTVTVGGGGAPGSAGGNSSVTVNSITYTANRGLQGSGLSGGAGGTGTTSNGAAGANGAARQTTTDAYGNVTETSPAIFGAGGNSGSGWGFGGNAGVNASGGNGTGFGGGGAGGATGAPGYVLVELISAGTQINTLRSQDGRSVTTNNLFTGNAKAWINFNGDTGAVRSSFNISGISNVSTGVWTITFTNALANTDYAVVGTAAGRVNHSNRAVSIAYDVAPTTSSVRIYTGMTGGSGTVGMFENSIYTCIAIFSTGA